MERFKKLLEPDSRFFMQLIRYFIVGGLATLIDITIFTILYKVFAFHYFWVAQPAGFIAGLATNYLLSIYVVFTNRNLANRNHERLIFFSTAFIGFLLNSLLLYWFVENTSLNEFVSKILAVLITFSWNFLSKKLILFK